MYYRLPYISRVVLSLKTLALYIYRSRGTIQNNQHSYPIYSSYIMDSFSMLTIDFFCADQL
jgi:hypothetical protein